jgi:virulence-associated protein VagC
MVDVKFQSKFKKMISLEELRQYPELKNLLILRKGNRLSMTPIDKKEWDAIKTNTPEVAEQEIDVFSDLIWDKAMTNVAYIDHFSANFIFLFKCEATVVYSYVINTSNATVDFLSAEGIQWLSENMFSDEVAIQRGKKDISEDRNGALFAIIKQGGIISKGELFSKLDLLLNQ